MCTPFQVLHQQRSRSGEQSSGWLFAATQLLPQLLCYVYREQHFMVVLIKATALPIKYRVEGISSWDFHFVCLQLIRRRGETFLFPTRNSKMNSNHQIHIQFWEASQWPLHCRTKFTVISKVGPQGLWVFGKERKGSFWKVDYWDFSRKAVNDWQVQTLEACSGKKRGEHVIPRLTRVFRSWQ